ncbi:MAG: phosphohistidine phosphatase SixA [bacterium]
MSLYLVRHGKYLSSDQDPKKGLSQYGSEEIKRVAGQIKKFRSPVFCIKHSGKKRALQTAEIIASVLNPDIKIQKINGINPQDDVISFADKIDNDKNEMLVGHLPFMEKLISYLITGSQDKKVLEFLNGTAVCLNKELREWVIQWAVQPGNK